MRSSAGLCVFALLCTMTACAQSSPGPGEPSGAGDSGTGDSGTGAKDSGSGPGDAASAHEGGSVADSGSGSGDSAAGDSAAGDSAAGDSAAGDSASGPEGGFDQDSGPASAGVHAVGNQIYDGTKPIRLLGVDRPGTEYQCVNGQGIFDGPSDQASITAMLTWDVNAVRIPLNDDCWLGLNGVAAMYSGPTYQKAISDYVTLLLASGIYPILDLHWTEDAGAKATDQQPMPDANGTAFWASVAGVFGSQNKVIFDLFNEPFPDDNMDATSAWTCWANGGSNCPDVSYPVVGMSAMLAAVRGTGASNLVVLGGLEYSNDLTQWLTYAPSDDNIAVSWHVYDNSNYTSSHSFMADAAPVLAKFPIVATEIGQASGTACDGKFITTIMDYLDAPGAGIPAQSYLAWSWSTDNTPHLLTDYTGTPTCDGATYKAHLLAEQ
jgi:endoglucanase